MSPTNSTNNIRVVAAIDFGTTYSGFACAHKNNPKEIYVQDFEGSFKAPTVLKYDKSFDKVISWGIPALAERTNRRKSNADDSKPVELFKLHLRNNKESPYLPEELDYKKAITDYLHEIGEMMKSYLKETYKSLNFFDQVLVILTVPAEFNNNAILIMRDCAFKAELTDARNSRNLRFISEPEAAAVHCMNFLSGNEIKTEDSFMIVDCGGGTVDLTTRQILLGNTLSEITERVGEYCGSSFIDKRFIEFLERKFGKSAIDILKKNHYRQLQYLVQEFCNKIKFPFTGEPFQDDDEVELDIQELCPVLKQYCRNSDFFNEMEESEWIMVLTHKDVKDMFDPIIAEIIRLIRGQLNSISKCSAIILVGGFSESKYLQKRIIQEFQHKLKNISVPSHPMVAVVKGAVEYGMKEHVITSRILKWTYGTDIAREWEPNDPPSKKLSNGMVKAFYTLAKRGTYLTKATTTFKPYSLFQRKVSFNIYITPDYEADPKYIDDDDVNLLNKWEIDIPILKDFDDQTILLTLNFSNIEILATAENLKTKDRYQITFNYEV